MRLRVELMEELSADDIIANFLLKASCSPSGSQAAQQLSRACAKRRDAGRGLRMDEI
jgi:hypothetical protein